jgi:hypothetical protein
MIALLNVILSASATTELPNEKTKNNLIYK